MQVLESKDGRGEIWEITKRSLYMNPICPSETHPFTNRWFNFNESALTPEANAAWVINQEKGYFGFLPNRRIKHLIIGSFSIWASVHHNPPHAGFDFAFFYCSRVNGFFPFLKVLNGYQFFPDDQSTTSHEKMQSVTNFFLHYELGITDIIEKVQRTDDRCISNLDRSLNPLQFNNLCQLLANYSEVTHVYCTSSFVKDLFVKSLRKCNIRRVIHTSILFSPGPMARVPATGILNKDRSRYEYENSLRWHLTQIPFISDLDADTDQIRVAKWAKGFRTLPGLVHPEILTHPSFIAVENRL